MTSNKHKKKWLTRCAARAAVALLGTGLLATVSTNATARMILTLDDLATVNADGTPLVDVIIIDDADGSVGDATAKGAATTADLLAGDGGIMYMGTVGSFVVNITTGLSNPIIGPQAKLDLNSINVSGAAGTIEIMLTDTDYTSTGGRLSSSVGGTTNGTVTVTASGDVGNSEFGQSVIIGPQVFTGGAFSSDLSTPFVTGGAPFSMSQTVTIAHTRPGQVTSLDHLLQVPEPGTLGLIGIGLAGMGLLRRRKRAAAA